jgi:hypothetical protein
MLIEALIGPSPLGDVNLIELHTLVYVNLFYLVEIASTGSIKTLSFVYR